MANAGDAIRTPLAGERTTFLQTTRDTNGELLRSAYLIPPGFSIQYLLARAGLSATRKTTRLRSVARRRGCSPPGLLQRPFSL